MLCQEDPKDSEGKWTISPNIPLVYNPNLCEGKPWTREDFTEQIKPMCKCYKVLSVCVCGGGCGGVNNPNLCEGKPWTREDFMEQIKPMCKCRKVQSVCVWGGGGRGVGVYATPTCGKVNHGQRKTSQSKSNLCVSVTKYWVGGCVGGGRGVGVYTTPTYVKVNHGQGKTSWNRSNLCVSVTKYWVCVWGGRGWRCIQPQPV